MLNFDGRVVLITGAGRGLGREHALMFAQHGARVVVNDFAGEVEGGKLPSGHPASEVVEEIEGRGGEAIADGTSVTDWDGVHDLVHRVVDEWGDLDAVVNNAGILRDRTIAKLSEAEWDEVVDVHMKGTCAVAAAAASYWRDQAKSGVERARRIVSTSSGSGILFNPGQTNYAAAKAGIVAMTMVWAKELASYGVQCNAIAPMARTRLTLAAPGMGELVAERESGFDPWDPANVSPLVVYLASPACQFNGGVFHVVGGQVGLFDSWTLREPIERGGIWDPEELGDALAPLARSAPGGSLDSEVVTPAEVMGKVEEHVAAATS